MSRRIVIVGASAAGLRCAARLHRLEPSWKITVLERWPVYSYAACGLPFVLSGDIDSLADLRSTAWGTVRDARFFRDVKGVEVLERHDAVRIDPVERIVEAAAPDGVLRLGWDELVLATGASPRRLPGQPEHPRVRTFHTWNDVGPLKEGLIRGEIAHVAVVGAGLVGIELAEAFRTLWGVDVTLIEAGPDPLPRLLDREVAALAAARLGRHGVRLVTGAPVERIDPQADGVSVHHPGGTVRADAVVVAVGVDPEVRLAREAGIALGRTGAIAVDRHLATSVPHVWAAGDCVEVRHAVTGEPVHCPLGSLANRQGRVLAGILAGRGGRFPDVAGAMAVTVFGRFVAAAGCTLAAARAAGFDAEAVWMTTDDRAHYWPESEDLHLQLVFDRETSQLLGIQAYGSRCAVDAVDTVAQLLARGVSLEALAEVEHCYAPPIAPALAPVAVAAAVAMDRAEGVLAMGPLDEPRALRVLDVRLPAERDARPWTPTEAVCIPIEELAGRIRELDRGSAWLVLCERGTRSAEAVRMLAHHGIEARYLGGGMIWRSRATGGGS